MVVGVAFVAPCMGCAGCVRYRGIALYKARRRACNPVGAFGCVRDGTLNELCVDKGKSLFFSSTVLTTVFLFPYISSVYTLNGGAEAIRGDPPSFDSFGI